MTVISAENATTTTNHNAQIPTIAARMETYNAPRKSSNKNQLKFTSSDMMDVPAEQTAGSKLPFFAKRKGDPDDGYDPFAERKVTHPTSDAETLIHLLKGSLGSGILAMPNAFLSAGLWFGFFGTIFVGLLCTYCVHILVKCAHILCYRRRIPAMSFADVAEQAFLDGPPGVQKYSRFIRGVVNIFLTIDLLGCCCIYLVFVGTNIKQVVDFYSPDSPISVRMWILIFTCPLIFMCLVRNLKYLTPFSMVANVLMAIGIIITFIYIFDELPATTSRPGIVSFTEWPLFFGTVIFALEGIGVVMSLENDMKTPSHFIGCPSVLTIGMGVVTLLYTCVGFFGYLKYGDDTQGSITLNLPVTDKLAQSVKLMIAIGIFFTFTLQFYVPLNIIWKKLKESISEPKQKMSENMLRVSLVILCGAIAAALPTLGPFISLIGAVCLSTLGMIIPSVVELVVYYEYPGYGRFKWMLWKNIALIAFGVVGFVTGFYVSILEFRDEFSS